MKIRYSNGFSLSLWNDEYTELVVEEDHIAYLTTEGKWIKIRIPATWSQGSPHSKINDGSSLSNGAKGAEISSEQASPLSLDPASRTRNEQSTTKTEEVDFKDDIAKLKQGLEKLLEEDFCQISYVKPRFQFIAQTLEEIKTCHNSLNQRVNKINDHLNQVFKCDDEDEEDEEDFSQVETQKPTPGYYQKSNNKEPDPLFTKTKK